MGALGANLAAVYLHGSAVLGGFRWDRSDLDILALSRTALSDRQLSRVVRSLGALTYPANGLEFSLMTASEASRPEFPAPRFQLHQTTDGWDRAGKVVDGRGRDGDPDLVLHLSVCRATGVAIVGPSPRLSLAPVPDGMLLPAVRAEITWAREHAPLEYVVLTCARAWLFLETRRIVSKIEAGEWAAARYPDRQTIEAALARQRGTEAPLSRDAAHRLGAYVESLITAAERPIGYPTAGG